MSKEYKVWIEIEEYDSETLEHTNLDAPGAAVAVFDTYERAWKFCELLQERGEQQAQAWEAVEEEGVKVTACLQGGLHEYLVRLNVDEFRVVGLALAGLLPAKYYEAAGTLNKRLLEQAKLVHEERLRMIDGALKRASEVGAGPGG